MAGPYKLVAESVKAAKESQFNPLVITILPFQASTTVLAGAAALLMLALTASTYGLWQQNQCLLWHAANPNVAPVKGLHSAYAHFLIPVASMFLLLTVFAMLFLPNWFGACR